jgi:hypothetical protein
MLLEKIAEGRSRTDMRGKPRLILSQLRLPFRHFGTVLNF